MKRIETPVKRVPHKGIHESMKNEWRAELRYRHTALKEKAEDENDECEKRVRTRMQG